MFDWKKRFGVSLVLLAATWPMVGCDRDVMEAETPTGEEIEVEEEFGGGMEVEVD